MSVLVAGLTMSLDGFIAGPGTVPRICSTGPPTWSANSDVTVPASPA